MASAESSQHDKLRKRLEDELSHLKSSSDSTDYDWFLSCSALSSDYIQQPSTNSTSSTIPRVSNSALLAATPISPLKSPSIANNPNVKSPPSVSTTSASKDPNFFVGLSKTRTADARMMNPISKINTGSSVNSGLHRTATNVDTSDVGKSRVSAKPSPKYHEPLQPPSTQKKKGFFKKLFGSKSDDPKPEMNIYKSSSASKPTSNVLTSSPSNLSRTTSNVNSKYSPTSQQSILKPSVSGSISSNSTNTKSFNSRSNSFTSSERPELDADASPESSANNILKSFQQNLSLSDQYKEIDPELATYINEFESSNAHKMKDDIENVINSYNFIYTPIGLETIKYSEDKIPAHPNAPKSPSALTSKPRFGAPIEKELFLKYRKEKEERESSMFGSLLHKTKTNTPGTYAFNGMLNESEDTPPFNFEPLNYTPPPQKIDRKPPLKVLSNLKPMKKVAFAATTFVTDPPQQIPSRNPRKGNVEVCPNGELIIHKIDPQEKLNSATGMVVGGSGHLKLINQDNQQQQKQNGNGTPAENRDNIQIDVPNATSMTKTASQTSLDQTIKTEDRILAAKKAREHHADSENIDAQKEGLTIDKPMVKRKKHMDAPVVTLKMDELYTRCCHLREILPIPATLKQIPKGSTDPIPYLHLRNPRPSMIEILSFTDFIRIAPVICISLDGVSLTTEMFRIILSSLLYKKFLEKLSLRNTSIDEEGWKMLCLFLSMNKALKKLDITQCSALDVNTQRIKKKSKSATESRMVCNINDRSDRNWALLTASIIFRGGIDEIILTGCKIPDLKLFSNMLNLALVETSKIGLAYNNLSLQHCYVIARWLESNSNIVGVDLAFNDLSSNLKPFIQYLNSENNTDNNLMMLSLNSCNLIDCQDTDIFFNSLSKLNHLSYLDLSSNSKLMKTYIGKLSIYLPLFNQLLRLNISHNNLSTKSMVQFLELIPYVQKLNYLSIKGNELNDIVIESICKTLEYSSSLVSISLDDDKIDTRTEERIGLLTMRNIETQLYRSTGELKAKNGKLLSELMSEEDRKIIKEELGIEDNLSFTDALMIAIKSKDFDKQKLDKFLGIIVLVRSNIKHLISQLLELKNNGTLAFEGKEMLIRLFSIDKSFDKAIELINNNKLNSTKKCTDSVLNLSQYDEYLKNSFESSTTNSLNDIIKDLKKNPEKAESLKKAILTTKDPYDLIRMLKYCKYNNVEINDLFVKKYSDSPSSSRSNLEVASNIDSCLDDNDDVSIDSQASEHEITYSPSPDKDNNKLSEIYDMILKDLIVKPETKKQLE